MVVAVITAEKAAQIQGKEFSKDEIFGPVEIERIGWIISEREADTLDHSDIVEWVEDYKPPVQEEESPN